MECFELGADRKVLYQFRRWRCNDLGGFVASTLKEESIL
jgi:hypothetical protein